MSLWGRLFRGAKSLPIEQAIALVEKLVSFAKEAKGDRDRYRQLLRAAVEKGDLDGPLDTYGKANARANAYTRWPVLPDRAKAARRRPGDLAVLTRIDMSKQPMNFVLSRHN